MNFYVDGGCSGNGQRVFSARKMVMIVTDDDGIVVSENTDVGGSNNIAELRAVRDALALAARCDLARVTVFTDSRNNLSWCDARSKLGKKLNDRVAVVALRSEIASLRERVEMTLVWIPREENKAGHYIERKYCL